MAILPYLAILSKILVKRA